MKQPEVYFDIGKMARDLLYQDYKPQLAMHHDQRWLDWSIQLLLQSKEIVPGLNAKLRFIAPYRRSNSMVELQYFNGFAGITTGISLSTKPVLNFSGLLGNRFFSIGTGISFDTKTASFASCDAGFSFNSSILSASLTLTEKGRSLNASSYLSTNILNKSAIAAEMTHGFLNKKTNITLGTQIYPIPSMLIKTRVGTDGTIGCLLQKELFRSFFVTIEGETNVKHAKRSARMGFTCALKHKMR